MSQSTLRQQRRRAARKKEKIINPTNKSLTKDEEFVSKKEMQLLIKDMQKILNYAKLVDNHLWMLVETLDIKGILGWDDVNATEALYSEKEKKKQEKIKIILEEDLTVSEILLRIKEDQKLPGYEKFSINPIKDLNLNPYEVGALLKETNPTLDKNDLLLLGKSWDMTPDHFGLKTNTE